MPSPPELTVYFKQSAVTHPLPMGSSLRVGRGSRVHVRIDDASVSREHLVLHVGSTVEVEDLGSSNGTQIFPAGSGPQSSSRNQRSGEGLKLIPFERYPIAPGDVLRIGAIPTVLKDHNGEGDAHPTTHPPSFDDRLVLRDPEMRRVYELASRAAQSDISVLIHGETGSGKELLAAEVHNRSPRKNGKFLQINCAALSESLLESELFGHERGAFTGALATRAGVFEATQGGTLFLDEIGEMPLATQAKLLRVLEDRQIRRLGSNKNLPVDVRFIAATNRDLELEVSKGRFRGDLYYRISGIVLVVPPLRERPSEIETLARHFLGAFCRTTGTMEPRLTEEAVRGLLAYPWPGNVRELKNAMERAPFLSGGGPITAEHVPKANSWDDDPFPENENTDVLTVPTTRTAPIRSQSLRSPMRNQGQIETVTFRGISPEGREQAPHVGHSLGVPEGSPMPSPSAAGLPSPPEGYDERARVLWALEQALGNQSKAAELLGVSRRTLINRLESFALPRPRKKTEER